tara:strand:+ start:451 stop:864 length:414 start_codon:yes stop_codon:yes gene_type:complete
MPISSPVQVLVNDLQPNVGVGINIPFNKPGVFSLNFLTKDAIKNNLINFFLTDTGERYMNPNFGGGLKTFVFEQLSTNNLSSIENTFRSSLSTHFPRVNIIQLNITPNFDEYSVRIYFQYSVKNTQIQDNITIDFNK